MTTQEQRQEVLEKKDQVAATFRDLVASTEELLKATASYTSAEAEEVRAKLKIQLEQARANAHTWEDTAKQKVQQAQKVTEDYVHDNVWKSLGIAALVGLFLGCCASSGSRRD